MLIKDNVKIVKLLPKKILNRLRLPFMNIFNNFKTLLMFYSYPLEYALKRHYYRLLYIYTFVRRLNTLFTAGGRHCTESETVTAVILYIHSSTSHFNYLLNIHLNLRLPTPA